MASSLLSSAKRVDSSVSAATGPCNAYELFSLISGLPQALHIECITGYDDFVLVGSKDGHLLIYKITFRNQGKLTADIEIALSNKYFTTSIGSSSARKPISQIEVIPEHKILIALTTEGISTHDMAMHNCECISTLERTKGATLFALNIQRQTSLTGDPSLTVRMCVVVGKTLQLYYWKNRSFNLLRDDFFVPDVPRAISWHKETLLLGFKNEYCFLDLLSGKQQEICSKSKTGEPIVVPVSNTEYSVVNDKQSFIFQLQLMKDEYAKVPSEEKTEKKKNVIISWTEAPIGLVYDEPYFIGVLGTKAVEVRTVKPKLKIDSFQLTHAKLICSPKSGHVFIASSDSIWCLKSTPIDAQMDLFVKKNYFELALGLCNIWNEIASEKTKKFNQIQNLFAFHLFCEKKFKQAIRIFMELGTDASHVIGLFPGLLPPEFRHQIEYPGHVPELRGADLESAMENLIVFLTNSRTILLGSSNQTVPESASIVKGGPTIKSKRQLLQIIDTTLLKCYLQTKESLVASLLRLKDNYCHVEETERALMKHKKFNELIILYQTKGNHRKALETLQQQNNTERVIEYLQHLGREEMDLILEFAKRVLATDTEKGLKIFTEDLQEVEQLSRPRVYDFLQKHFSSLCIPYLEHVINIWEEKNSLFHNALLNLYREKFQESQDAEKKKNLRSRLREFLHKSQFYTPEIVLLHFPYEDLYEERALILERLGRHDQALSIYVIALNDVDEAMNYCQRVYDKTDKDKKEVFTILMKMLLSPAIPEIGITVLSGHKRTTPDVPNFMRLLKDYAPYLEPAKVLSCLPDDVEVREIQKFLMTSVQNHLSEKRKVLIQKGLINAEFLRASGQKRYYESETFYVDENTICAVCRKRMASQNAFVRYPDGSIAHFYCKPTGSSESQ